MRKHTLGSHPPAPVPSPDELDVPAVATAHITSEAADHPIENAFDGNRGPGGSRWIAATPGEQTLILALDAPQSIRQILLEVEETQDHRTQELQVSVSRDGGREYQDLVRQEFNFSPPGTTFEREAWPVGGGRVTHLRLWIKPDKGGRPCRASLTSLVLLRDGGSPPSTGA